MQLGPIDYYGPLDLDGPPRERRYTALLPDILDTTAPQLGSAPVDPGVSRRAEWRLPPAGDTPPAVALALDEALARILERRRGAEPALRQWDGLIDPYRLGWLAVAEAGSRAIASGGAPGTLALDARFIWTRVDDPVSLGGLVRCLQGCAGAAAACGAVFAGASLAPWTNGSLGQASGLVDITTATPATGNFPLQPGNFLFVAGQTRPELGGSDFALVGGLVRPQHRAAPRPTGQCLNVQRAVHRALGEGWARGARACGPGGLALALAEICRAAGVGAEVQLSFAPVDPYYAYAADDAVLFAESPGRFVLEVSPDRAAGLAAVLAGIPHACFAVAGGNALRVHPRLPDSPDPVLRLAT